MEHLTINVDEEIVTAFRHVEDWTSMGQIAKLLNLSYWKIERICWILAGKGVIFWKPGDKMQQLFRYNPNLGIKIQTNILEELDILLGKDYFVAGETALFLHNLTDHALYQRISEIALPKNRYNKLGAKIVDSLHDYATILPRNIPKRCDKSKIIADALSMGDVILLQKSTRNFRNLKFFGPFNLPALNIILEDVDLPRIKLFEYTLKALDFGLSQENFYKLCSKKPILDYVRKYLEGEKDIPDEYWNELRDAEHNVKGY
jgi:hypothetical protein